MSSVRCQFTFPGKIPQRSARLLTGLFLYGLGLALKIRGTLGAAPWDVLTLGVTVHLPLSFGVATVIVSTLILLRWFPLRERPSIATVLNALPVGPSADVGLVIFPETGLLCARIAYVVLGVFIVGVSIWVVRTTLEVTAICTGPLCQLFLPIFRLKLSKDGSTLTTGARLRYRDLRRWRYAVPAPRQCC